MLFQANIWYWLTPEIMLIVGLDIRSLIFECIWWVLEAIIKAFHKLANWKFGFVFHQLRGWLCVDGVRWSKDIEFRLKLCWLWVWISVFLFLSVLDGFLKQLLKHFINERIGSFGWLSTKFCIKSFGVFNVMAGKKKHNIEKSPPLPSIPKISVHPHPHEP